MPKEREMNINLFDKKQKSLNRLERSIKITAKYK